MFSIKIIQLWLVMMFTSYVLSQFYHYPPAEETLERFLNDSQLYNLIAVAPECLNPSYNANPLCSFDISNFNQEQVDQLVGNVGLLTPWLVCDKSNLSVLDFSKLVKIGHINDNGQSGYPLEGNNEALKITNDLMKIMLWK